MEFVWKGIWLVSSRLRFGACGSSLVETRFWLATEYFHAWQSHSFPSFARLSFRSNSFPPAFLAVSGIRGASPFPVLGRPDRVMAMGRPGLPQPQAAFGIAVPDSADGAPVAKAGPVKTRSDFPETWLWESLPEAA